MNLNQIQSTIKKTKITSVIGSVVLNGADQNLFQVLTIGNNAGGLQIKNLADPTQNQDAVTLAYLNSHGGAVSSVFGRTGAVTGQPGDYDTSMVGENGNLYFTNARARSAISLTTTGSSGPATYSSSTGVLNIPNYSGGSGTVTSVAMTVPNFLSVSGSPITTSGTLALSLASQTANTVLAAPDGSNGLPSFRAISRNDLVAAYQQVGQVFTELWTNLTNWANMGSPSASVSGGFLNISGTASTSNNYIKNTSYGKFNLEAAQITWSEVVGTIGASTSGIGFALVSQNTLFGTSFANSMMVNIELSNTSTGAIKWYFGSGTTFSVLQTSPVLLVPNTGDTLSITLTTYADKYELSYSINSGVPISDTFVAYTGGQEGVSGFTSVVHNAAAFSFFNIGGGSSHKVGPVTVKSLHNKNANLLFIGNSIVSGFGCLNLYNRMVTKLQKRTYTTVEVNARPSNSILDVNASEISAYNATKIVIAMACTNDLTQKTVSQTETDLATTLTALAGISNAAAPSGYSIANGNLVLSTELLRAAISASITTFNADIPTIYGAANVINFNSIGNTGSTAMPIPSASGTIANTFDAVHWNDYSNGLGADMCMKYFGLTRKDVYENEDVAVVNIASPKGWNTVINASSGTTLIYSMNSNREHYLSFCGYGTTNASAMTTAIRAAQSGGENVILGQTTAGFGIWANSSVSNNYSATRRLLIDYSGNIGTGSTASVVYRTTNGGSNVSAHLMVDPSSSVTAGNQLAYDNTNYLSWLKDNGTLRIAIASMQPSDQVSTAGSETTTFGAWVKPAGSAMVQRTAIMGKETNLTESSATAFARITLTAGQYTGGEITVVVQANDGTDFQSVTSRFAYSAVMKSTTVTVAIETPVQTTSVSSGTLTVTITAVDSGSGNLDFKANAVSSLTQTSLQAQCYMTKNYLGTISAQ